MADDRTAVPSLYSRAIEVVLREVVTEENHNFDLENLPDRIINDLLEECLSNGPKKYLGKQVPVRKQKIFFKKVSLNIWIRLLKHEAYRRTLTEYYQKLYNYDTKYGSIVSANGFEQRINKVFVKSFEEWASEISLTKHIEYGLILGSFFSETSWYEVSEGILQYVRQLCDKLPENGAPTLIIKLECCQRLFHTLSMFFKFDDAALIMVEIETLRRRLALCGTPVNYALLFTEYSRYNFSKNNYKESRKWIHKAMNQLHEKLPTSTIVDVLRQASKVCVVTRDFSKAEYLIQQALGRAYLHYGEGSCKLAALLLDFGFYLLYSDHIDQCVTVYQKAYSLRKKMFSDSNNLFVAIAEEDLAYALYVSEYNSGYFDLAMRHAKAAINTMQILLPPGSLMLSSANRVKALILEEMAIDAYSIHNSCVNLDMLKEAEKLHKDALMLTKRMLGEENILTAKHYGNLGRLYQSMRKYKEAEMMHLKAIRIKEKTLGVDDHEVGLSVGHLASLYNYHMAKYEEAELLYRRSINISIKLYSEAYSGLEYDYRGLIHVYDQMSDAEQFLIYSNKLHKWNALRNICVADSSNSNFYENIEIEPLKVVLSVSEMNVPYEHADGESSQC